MNINIMLLLLNIIELTNFQDRKHALEPIAKKLQAVIDAADNTQESVSATRNITVTVDKGAVNNLRAALAALT